MTIEELMVWLTENSNEWCLEVNPHAGNYESRESYVKFMDKDDWREELNEGDNLYEIRIYPNTPVSQYLIFGTDLKQVLESAKTAVAPHRLDGSVPFRFNEESRSK